MNTQHTNRQRRTDFGARKRRAHNDSRTPSRHTSPGARTGGGRPGGRSNDRPGPRFAHRGSQGGGNPSKRRMPTFDPTNFINRQPQEAANDPQYVPVHTFATLGLDGSLLSVLNSKKITVPTPIQDQIIPHILKGSDVIGIAETGTGKTAAFLLPLIERTRSKQTTQTLVLTPTRELAVQIEKELRLFAGAQRIFSTLCVGGVGISPQIRSLKKHNHFIIGTPGRITDLIDRRCIDPSQITAVVLDEADRMLDMGFIHDMKRILSRIPRSRMTLLFSATMSPSTAALAQEFLHDPISVSVKKHDVTRTVRQDVVSYGAHNKYETLTALLRTSDLKRVIVFGAMKHSVDKLAKQLSADGIHAESIQGNKSHSQRQRALENFKNNKVQVLVATDVAARGIHVDNVSHVINYDLPSSFDDYVHRIGRTGRGEHSGIALTFVPEKSAHPVHENRGNAPQQGAHSTRRQPAHRYPRRGR